MTAGSKLKHTNWNPSCGLSEDGSLSLLTRGLTLSPLFPVISTTLSTKTWTSQWGIQALPNICEMELSPADFGKRTWAPALWSEWRGQNRPPHCRAQPRCSCWGHPGNRRTDRQTPPGWGDVEGAIAYQLLSESGNWWQNWANCNPGNCCERAAEQVSATTGWVTSTTGINIWKLPCKLPKNPWFLTKGLFKGLHSATRSLAQAAQQRAGGALCAAEIRGFTVFWEWGSREFRVLNVFSAYLWGSQAVLQNLYHKLCTP